MCDSVFQVQSICEGISREVWKLFIFEQNLGVIQVLWGILRSISRFIGLIVVWHAHPLYIRDEFNKLGKDLEAYKGRDTKRYHDILEQMRSSFRQCGEVSSFFFFFLFSRISPALIYVVVFNLEIELKTECLALCTNSHYHWPVYSFVLVHLYLYQRIIMTLNIVFLDSVFPVNEQCYFIGLTPDLLQRHKRLKKIFIVLYEELKVANLLVFINLMLDFLGHF